MEQEQQQAPLAAQAQNGSAKPTGGKWSSDEDDRLRQVVKEHGPKNWKVISKLAFNGARSDVQCLHRWQKVLRPGLVKGPWLQSEDDIIIHLIKTHGLGNIKWSEIAASLPGRLGKQCRERWVNHLDPDLKKTPWTEEEDRVLMEQQTNLGNKWREIAAFLPGRSENSVKNRWNSARRKRKRTEAAQADQDGDSPEGGKTKEKKAAKPKAAKRASRAKGNNNNSNNNGGGGRKKANAATDQPPPPPALLHGRDAFESIVHGGLPGTAHGHGGYQGLGFPPPPPSMPHGMNGMSPNFFQPMGGNQGRGGMGNSPTINDFEMFFGQGFMGNQGRMQMPSFLQKADTGLGFGFGFGGAGMHDPSRGMPKHGMGMGGGRGLGQHHHGHGGGNSGSMSPVFLHAMGMSDTSGFSGLGFGSGGANVVPAPPGFHGVKMDQAGAGAHQQGASMRSMASPSAHNVLGSEALLESFKLSSPPRPAQPAQSASAGGTKATATPSKTTKKKAKKEEADESPQPPPPPAVMTELPKAAKAAKTKAPASEGGDSADDGDDDDSDGPGKVMNGFMVVGKSLSSKHRQMLREDVAAMEDKSFFKSRSKVPNSDDMEVLGLSAGQGPRDHDEMFELLTFDDLVGEIP